MKKINWKLLNLAFWIEVILSYSLPYKVVDPFHYQVGFPFPFLSVYDTAIEISPLASNHLNPLALLLNGLIIYLVLSFIKQIYQNLKRINNK